MKFKYHPGLPIPNGKTCLWLFLSTEIMFFAGLIGAYIVLRFGAVTWPSTHDVHLVEYLGAINTAVLIGSSITVVLALEAAKPPSKAEPAPPLNADRIEVVDKIAIHVDAAEKLLREDPAGTRGRLMLL